MKKKYLGVLAFLAAVTLLGAVTVELATEHPIGYKEPVATEHPIGYSYPIFPDTNG